MNSLFRKTLIFVAVMAVVATAGWFGRKAYKKSAEHRLISQANGYIQKKDWRNTSLCLQRALQVNPLSVEASKLMADILESAGVPTALSWRIRVAALQPNNPTNRLLWAETAIKAHELDSANEALSKLDEKSKTTVSYHKLAGALAWNRGQAVEAEQHCMDVLRLEPANPANVVNLATIHLASTNKAVVDAARLSLAQVPTNTPLHIVALRHLLGDAAVRKSSSEAVAFSAQIIRDPLAELPDRLNHLALIRDSKTGDYNQMLGAVEISAQRSPADAYILARWLIKTESPAAAFNWLQKLPPDTQTNQPVPLILADCLIALKDWNGLLALVNRKDWGEAEFYRLAVESLAQRSLGQNAAADNTWRKTVRLTQHRLDRSSQLVKVTAAWGWAVQNAEVLHEIIDEFPKEKWAADQLSEQLYAGGKTRDLQELLVKTQSADPADPRLKNNLANICLLRKSELDRAHRMAKEAYDSAPDNPFFISTYAYSLSLQDKRDEAIKVLEGLKPEYLQIPAVAAYYGVIQAQSGHRELARESLARACAANLLPEEKEIVRLAQARL